MGCPPGRGILIRQGRLLRERPVEECPKHLHQLVGGARRSAARLLALFHVLPAILHMKARRPFLRNGRERCACPFASAGRASEMQQI